MRQTGVMIADCLSHIICHDTAEEDKTLNIHITGLMTFQDGKLQDIHHQTLLDPQLVKLELYRITGVKVKGTWMQIYMHSGYIDSTCTLQMASL